MKKWFGFSAVFLSVYIFFLLATIPVNSVLAFITLPKNIKVESAEGTVWQANIKQLIVETDKRNKKQINIYDINAELSLLSLLMFNPSIELTFGGALFAGPEGKLTLTNLLGDPSVEQAEISIEAREVAQQLTLPISVSAKGYIDINLEQLTLGNPVCDIVKGKISWQKASINALDQNASLGNLSADLNCEKGALAVNVDEKNDLGLSFTAYVRKAGKISGRGYLKPTENFPRELNTVLPFLGKKDSKGRYRLMF